MNLRKFSKKFFVALQINLMFNQNLRQIGQGFPEL